LEAKLNLLERGNPDGNTKEVKKLENQLKKAIEDLAAQAKAIKAGSDHSDLDKISVNG
jgi:hypothetical protein